MPVHVIEEHVLQALLLAMGVLRGLRVIAMELVCKACELVIWGA